MSPVVKHAKYWDIGKLKGEGEVEILPPPPLSPPWGVLESAIFGVVGPEGAYVMYISIIFHYCCRDIEEAQLSPRARNASCHYDRNRRAVSLRQLSFKWYQGIEYRFADMEHKLADFDEEQHIRYFM